MGDIETMILREYLYVDVDKVRSFVGQMEGGVPEEARTTERSDKKNNVGVKGFASHERNWATEEYIHKSLADAMFSEFEESLEALGLLKDLSMELQEGDYWTSPSLRNEAPAGTLTRITALGAFFDARYVANVMSGFGAAVLGWGEFVPSLRESERPIPPGKGARKGESGRNRSQVKRPEGAQYLEDIVREFPPVPDGSGGYSITPEMLRGIIQIARGIFQPGVHLNLTPADNDRFSIQVRLEEGRRYLESDPEILFSRYGFEKQEWTVVGAIGCHSPMGEPAAPTADAFSEAMDGDALSRKEFGAVINSFLEYFARIGFADLPQWPGFSLVPLAVYRSVPNSAGALPVEP